MENINKLIAINQMLSSELELKPLLKSILSTVVDLFSCDAASIMFYDEDQEQLNFSVAVGAESDELDAIPIPVEGSIAGLIFKNRIPMIVNDLSKSPNHYSIVEERTGYQVRTLLGVPIDIRDRTIGILEGLNKIEGEFTEADAQLLLLVAAQTAVAINNAHIIQELKEANQELRQADKLKADFMAVASHELRTPLGIILGYATFLKEEAKGELSEHAGTLHGAAMRLRALLEDMTNMNLLYTGATKLRPHPIQIQTIMKNVYDKASIMTEAADHRLELIQPSQDLWVNADERLEKVFENLLNNAVRFTPPKGEIIVRVSAFEDEVLVEVQDSGIGIHPNEVQRIFEHFYQVEHHMRRRYEGLGLGLAIARGMVELHHGRIWAESDGPGKGSIFKVLLPRFSI